VRGGHYQATFLRDFAYKVLALPELFADESTVGSFELFFEHMSADLCPPEYIHVDGHLDYWCVGSGPLPDNPPSLAVAVLAYCRASGNKAYLSQRAGLLLEALRAMPRHPVSGLVWIDPMQPHSPYGYTDNIQKTGEELFSSVLLYDACRQMAEALGDIGLTGDAISMAAMAAQVQLGLEGLYDPESGLYFAASYHCRQPDVWGSALAVSCGAAGARCDQVAGALAGMYDRIVWRGQLRHLPEPMLWEKMLGQGRKFRRFEDGKFFARGMGRQDLVLAREPNTYQNGAYWATPVGWFVRALARVDRSLAERTLLDLVEFYQEEGVWECVYPPDYRKEREYTISVVMPLLGFRALGALADVYPMRSSRSGQ
jgi:hypothetical protein